MTEKLNTRIGSILVYTRTPVKGRYASHLGYSAHFAYSPDGKAYRALNQNYGILFASATIREPNTLNEKGLKNPRLFYTDDGSFGIAAVRVNADGSPDEESKGDVFLWTSNDLIHFEELGLVCLKKDVYVEEAVCIYDISIRQYVIKWLGSNGVYYRNTLTDLRNVNSVSVCVPGESFSAAYSGNGPEGAVNGNVLSVDHSFGERLSLRWTPLENVSVKVPESITVMNEEDVRSIQATAYYTDGSTAQKRVKWDVEGIDFNKPGVYKISGTVVSNTYSFPLAKGYADPDILFWDGKYYFIATNDNTNDVGLYVREADTVAGLFEERVKEYLILEKDEKRDLIQTFWAPEFHVIGGELYILFAVSGKKWGPMSHMMRLKKKGNILDPDSWEDPVRVQKKDGSFLTTGEAEITLDMTFFEADGICYLAWSYRIWTGTPHDSGSMIYIATIDPVDPWQLTSNPVLLSRPQYGWENNEHTINNEGPYAFVTSDRVYLTYSGGAAGGYTYVLGLLSAKREEDLLNPKRWTKNNSPVLSYYSMEGVYGPGHNAFYTDQYGNLMITYHAQESLQSNLRCTGIHRVHFNIDGEPAFDLSSDRDLNKQYATVMTNIIVL